MENTLRCFSIKNGENLWSVSTELTIVSSQKKQSIILTKNEKIFISEAKKYIYYVLKYYSKSNIRNKTIVLNNAADVTDPINSSQYFENRNNLTSFI